MVNHARTLLANLAPGDPALWGEEFIEPTFTPVALPGAVQVLRTVLFGTAPDRAFINYRVRQLLAVVHASDQAAFLTMHDPRLTYDLAETQWLPPAWETPRVFQLTGAPAPLFFSGTAAAPDQMGKLVLTFTLAIPDSDLVTLQRLTPPMAQTSVPFTFAAGRSTGVPLPGSGLTCYLGTDAPETSWQVEHWLRPQWDLGSLVAALATLGEPFFLALFGVTHAEPYQTWRNLWYQSRVLPQRLAGVLLAALQLTEEARRGRRT